MKHRGQPTRSMAFASGAFPRSTLSSASMEFTHVPSSFAIFDVYDTEDVDDDDLAPSGDGGMLVFCVNSKHELFLLLIMLNLFQAKLKWLSNEVIIYKNRSPMAMGIMRLDKPKY